MRFLRRFACFLDYYLEDQLLWTSNPRKSPELSRILYHFFSRCTYHIPRYTIYVPESTLSIGDIELIFSSLYIERIKKLSLFLEKSSTLDSRVDNDNWLKKRESDYWIKRAYKYIYRGYSYRIITLVGGSYWLIQYNFFHSNRAFSRFRNLILVISIP